MKIYHVKSSGNELFTVLLSVNAGWSHEPLGKEGISHFLEHAIFLGNEKYPDPDIHTARFGVTLNGETMADRTIFFFNSLVEDAQDILEVLLSLVFQPSFDEEKVLEEKKSKIIPAIVKESDYYPWELAYEWARNLIFEWDFRKSMGTEDSLKGMDVEDLEEWHKKYYHTLNSILLLSEFMEVEDIAPVEGGTPERHRIKYEEKEMVLEKNIGNVEIVYAFPFKSYDIRAYILSTILGNYPISLFWRAFHRDAYMVESRVEWHEWGGLFLYIGANTKEHGRIRRKFESFIDSLRISSEDLNRAKKIMTLEVIEKEKSPHSLKHLLSIDPLLKFEGFRAILERINEVEISDLRDYANEVLDLVSLREVVVK